MSLVATGQELIAIMMYYRTKVYIYREDIYILYPGYVSGTAIRVPEITRGNPLKTHKKTQNTG
jgi:hypothetical protein